MAKKKQVNPDPEQNQFQIRPENKKAKMWLWLGVCGVTAIIALMWGWAFKEQIANLNWHKSFESNLISGGKNDWNKLFQSESVGEEKSVKSQLAEVMERIIEAASSSATFSTSTTPSTTKTNL